MVTSVYIVKYRNIDLVTVSRIRAFSCSLVGQRVSSKGRILILTWDSLEMSVYTRKTVVKGL